ncbi:MAG: hypothetical protein KKH80_01490 [Candidatus Omnitrophica bacterium]|nr:hypothetical protein [Candidatus Omnitrophota bacterium]
MRLGKFLTTVLLITVTSFFYVNQQIKIVQLAYEEQEKSAYLNSLVNQSNNLKYNINCRTSLVSMAGLWQKGNFEWPHQEQLVSLSTTDKAAEKSKGVSEKRNILAGLFRLKSQAEATPIKPRR